MWARAIDVPPSSRHLVTQVLVPVEPDRIILDVWEIHSGSDATREKLSRPFDFTDVLAFIP